jgi:hypothetical protein
MACQAFANLLSYAVNGQLQPDIVMVSVTNDINTNGIACINNNMSSCSTYCKNLTKSSAACFSCLSQAYSCPPGLVQGNTCQNTPVNCVADPNNGCCSKGCCPNAEQAVQCGNCLAAKAGKNGGQSSVTTLEVCMKESGLSQTDKILIGVFVSLAVVIAVVATVVVLRYKQARSKKDTFVDDLRLKGVNRDVIRQIQNLDSSRINSDVFKAVDTHLLLQKDAGAASTSAVASKATFAGSSDLDL